MGPAASFTSLPGESIGTEAVLLREKEVSMTKPGSMRPNVNPRPTAL